jgi:hypothetical protein
VIRIALFYRVRSDWSDRIGRQICVAREVTMTRGAVSPEQIHMSPASIP